jgi:glycerol kinase
LEGSVSTAGAAVEWLIEIGLISEPSETEKLAAKTRGAGSGGVFFIPAFSGLYAPYWDPYARGLFIGLTRYTRREHLVHAVLEAIAWRLRDVYETMVRDAGVKPDAIRVDGGVARNKYLLQLQADILGIPVEKPRDLEATGLGAAYAAGLGVGLWGNTDELTRLRRIEAVYKPIWTGEKREELYRIWRLAVKRSLNWASEAGGLPSTYAYDP